MLKEAKSATMNIFRKQNIFISNHFVKIELSYVFTINLFTIAETARKSELSYIIGVCFYCWYFLRPSNNYKQLIFNINAVVLILIIC